MVTNLSTQHSLVSNWIAELRDVNIQKDRMRFRRNLERIGEVAAVEISKHLPFKTINVETPLGISPTMVMESQPIIGTILRAGMAMHAGLLSYFDMADNAFISAYRKHLPDGSFDIHMEYLSCPDLDGRILILSDPMLATGASLVKTIKYLKEEGSPSEIYFVCAIAATDGIAHVQKHCPDVKIWCGTIDDELTAKGYIVPGLGDAGDLAYGEKMQS
jgi:uracil phosphoribosyltransferase